MDYRILLLSLVFPLAARAQSPARQEQEEDLEVPASAAEAPPESPPAALPAPANSGAPASPAPGPASQPAPTPAAPAAAPPLASAAQGTPPSSVAATVEAPHSVRQLRAGKPPASGISAGNLEQSAHSRPIPSGLVLGGYLHADFQSNALSEDQIHQSGQLLNQDRFLVRRARLRLDRGWQYVSGTLELDANTVHGVHVGIRRAEGSVFYRGQNPLSGPPLVVFTAGATDLPFGYELMESSRTRFFMERSLGSSALFPSEADVGVKLSGALGFLRYGLALTSGEPLTGDALPSDPNAAKDFTGRLGVEVSPSKVFSISGGTSFAVGKGFHSGQPATKDTVIWRDDDGNGSVSLSELVGVPGSAASPSSNFDRWALGLDLQVGFVTPLGRTRLFAEGFVATNHDRGFAIADPVATGGDIRHAGAYAALVQDVTRYGVAGLRVAFYDPNSDLLEERRGKLLPREQSITTVSPLIGLVLQDRARLLLQYDFVRDELARDARGIPADAENDQLTARLQVEL